MANFAPFFVGLYTNTSVDEVVQHIVY